MFQTNLIHTSDQRNKAHQSSDPSLCDAWIDNRTTPFKRFDVTITNIYKHHTRPTAMSRMLVIMFATIHGVTVSSTITYPPWDSHSSWQHWIYVFIFWSHPPPWFPPCCTAKPWYNHNIITISSQPKIFTRKASPGTSSILTATWLKYAAVANVVQLQNEMQ